MEDAADNCHYPELIGEPLRLELNFTFPLEHATELIVLAERLSSVAVDRFGAVEMDNIAFQQIFNHIPQLKYRCLGSFPLDHVQTDLNETFAILNTQPSNMQGEHCIMIANFRHKWYLPDFC